MYVYEVVGDVVEYVVFVGVKDDGVGVVGYGVYEGVGSSLGLGYGKCFLRWKR